MRAWHLLLAVLATLSSPVQVASTEDSLLSPSNTTQLNTNRLSNDSAVIVYVSMNAGLMESKHLNGKAEKEKEKEKERTESVKFSEQQQEFTVNKRYRKNSIEMPLNATRRQIVPVNSKENDVKRLTTPSMEIQSFTMKSSLNKNRNYSGMQRSHRNWIYEEKKRRYFNRHHHKRLLKLANRRKVKYPVAHISKEKALATPDLQMSINQQITSQNVSSSDIYTSSKHQLHNTPSVIDLHASKAEKDNVIQKSAQTGKYERNEPHNGAMANLNVQNEIKKSLLSLLNMERPPVIDRSKIVIPKFMTQLYAQKKYQDWNYVARSFTHKRKY